MELERVWTCLTEGARQVMQTDGAAVCLLSADGAQMVMAAASGLPAISWPREPFEVTCSPLDKEALSGCPTIVKDAKNDPRAVNVPEDYRSVLCVPLVYENESIGTLHVYAVAPDCFGEEEAARLAPLADLGAATIATSRALMELEASAISEARFIHVATHELRSPITVAQSLVRGVLKGYAGALTDKQTEVFVRISRRLDFLERLTNDLLDLAAGKSPRSAEEGLVLLNASVGEAVLTLQSQAEDKGLELILRPCRHRLVVWATEEGLDRAFVNLVGNAVKYTPSGGTVTVTVRRVGDQAQVEVADTGIGIPEEALPHLFEEFYRAPNAKALDEVGTGLGLTIVKDLVERYGGRIEVESTVRQGSTFTVTFPIHQLADHAAGL